MIIREAQHTDLAVILDIMNNAILHTTSIYDYNIRSAEFIESWFAKKQSDKMPVLVCEEDGETIAYGSYGSFRAWDGYKFSVEHSIYVMNEFQGKGVGKMLLKALIERAIKDGFHTMIAGIDSSNIKSIEFHKKLDFNVVGKFTQVGYKFNKWLDLTFMQRML